MTDEKIAGVDGCPGGWILVTRRNTELPVAKLCKSFREVISETRDCKSVMVDIPMKLNEKGFRTVDVMAREMLKKIGRSSSVFMTPVKEAIENQVVYTSNEDYKRICSINVLHTDKKIPKQTFCLINKIREVNCVDPLPENIHEFHPELVWSRFVTDKEFPSKKNQDGENRRLKILEKALNVSCEELNRIIEQAGPKSKVHRDDVIDALAGLIAAGNPLKLQDEDGYATIYY